MSRFAYLRTPYTEDVIYLMRLVVAALLALTPLVTEETTASLGEVVTDDETCGGADCPSPPSELPGPSDS